MKLLLINGPNLNLLGMRETDVYGTETFESYFEKLKAQFPAIELSYHQSNIEGELISKIQEVGFSHSGIILNAGAYTHTSIGIADAIKVNGCHGDPKISSQERRDRRIQTKKVLYTTSQLTDSHQCCHTSTERNRIIKKTQTRDLRYQSKKLYR